MSSLGGSEPGSDAGRAAALLRRIVGLLARSYVVMLVLGIVLGLQVAPAVSELGAQPGGGTVAIVPIAGGIDGGNAASVAARLQQARTDPSIDAVVLRINSPGGGASSSETMYLQVKQTAEEMPVVTSVDTIAASGAYYAAAPSDDIFVKPASFIGSVGVIAIFPASVPPIDRVLTTGPDKIGSSEPRDRLYQARSLQQAFLSAVVTNREDRLEISRERLGYAKVYSGGKAVSLGVADEIGGISAAVRRAATRANLDDYRVRVLGYDGEVRFLTRSSYVAANVSEKTLVSPETFVGDPDELAASNFVMLPPSVVRAALESENATATTTGVIANESAAP
ncbi:MAG: S49 family peptidase [Halobacteriales archaeon]